MKTQERLDQIASLAAQQAADVKDTAELAKLFVNLGRHIRELSIRWGTIEKEIIRRIYVSYPIGTRVRITAELHRGEIGFIARIAYLNDEAIPCFKISQARQSDGAPSMRYFELTYDPTQFEKEG